MMAAALETPRRRVVDPTTGTVLVRLQRGEHDISGSPDEVLSAEVAAAVALSLRDPQKSIGGLAVLLLPQVAEAANGTDPIAETYGSYQLERLFGDLERRGCRRTRLVCGVYGGARVTGPDPEGGPRTADFVLRYLEDWGLAPEEQEVGGNVARRIQLASVAGRTRILSLAPQRAAQILQQEERRAPQVLRHADGSVELFE